MGAQSYNPSTHTNTQKHTHADGIETVHVCLTRLTDVAARFQLFPYLAPHVRWAAFGTNDTHTRARTHSFAHSLPQLSHQLSLTHQIYVLCAGGIPAPVWFCVLARDWDVFTIWRNVQYLVMWKAALSGQESYKHTLFYWMGLRFLFVHLGARVRNLNAFTCGFTLGDPILLCAFGEWTPTCVCLLVL